MFAGTISAKTSGTWSPLVGRMPMEVVVLLGYGSHRRHVLGPGRRSRPKWRTSTGSATCPPFQHRGNRQATHFLVPVLPITAVIIGVGATRRYYGMMPPHHEHFPSLFPDEALDGFLPLLLLPVPVQLGLPVWVLPLLLLLLLHLLMLMIF